MNVNALLFQVKCSRRRQRRGVLLIEILAAIVLLAIMSVTCFELFQSISEESGTSSQSINTVSSPSTDQTQLQTKESSANKSNGVDRVALEQFADWYFTEEKSAITNANEKAGNAAQPATPTASQPSTEGTTSLKSAEVHPNQKYDETVDWPAEFRSSLPSGEAWPSVHITWMPATTDLAEDGDNQNEPQSSSAMSAQHRWVVFACDNVKIWRWVRVVLDPEAKGNSTSRGVRP